MIVFYYITNKNNSMNKSIFKPIIAGALLGAFVFFTGPLLLVVLLLKFIFTPFGMWRMRGYGGMGYGRMGMQPLAFADKVRGMNEEEYNDFQSKMKDRFQHRCGHYNETK
jgi:hypothetical protein